MTRQQQRQQQRHASDLESPAQRMAATPVNMDSSVMPQAEAAPFAAAAREAAQEREAAIRAIGLDGIVLDGETIRRILRAAGLSSDTLAAMIGYSGALVRAWESGRRRCPPHLYLPLVETISNVRQNKAIKAVPGTCVHHECVVAGHRAA